MSSLLLWSALMTVCAGLSVGADDRGEPRLPGAAFDDFRIGDGELDGAGQEATSGESLDRGDAAAVDASAESSPTDIPRVARAIHPVDGVLPDDASDATEPSIPLSPRLAKLRDRVRQALAYYHRRRLNTRDHNPWEVMHSIVAYGVSSTLNKDAPDGPPVNAISWVCWNGSLKGERILEIDRGTVAARKGPKVQGHPGQLLAILAQSRVSLDYPMRVDGRDFTLADLVESEKYGCQAGTELTFKLISLAHYLDIDATWKNYAGQTWNIERLVREELSQPIKGAACGGTHRLMGLAYAVRKREKSGLPMSGDFLRAQKFLDQYHAYTFKLQNADGSFSTEWFNGRGARPDLGRRLQTSGHILEWLSYSLPADMLDDPRVVKAVEYLTNMLLEGKGQSWEIGPLGHGTHALVIYDDRMFKPHDAPPPAVADDADAAGVIAAPYPSTDVDLDDDAPSIDEPAATARPGRRAAPPSGARAPAARRPSSARSPRG